MVQQSLPLGGLSRHTLGPHRRGLNTPSLLCFNLQQFSSQLNPRTFIIHPALLSGATLGHQPLCVCPDCRQTVWCQCWIYSSYSCLVLFNFTLYYYYQLHILNIIILYCCVFVQFSHLVSCFNSHSLCLYTPCEQGYLHWKVHILSLVLSFNPYYRIVNMDSCLAGPHHLYVPSYSTYFT